MLAVSRAVDYSFSCHRVYHAVFSRAKSAHGQVNVLGCSIGKNSMEKEGHQWVFPKDWVRSNVLHEYNEAIFDTSDKEIRASGVYIRVSKVWDDCTGIILDAASCHQWS